MAYIRYIEPNSVDSHQTSPAYMLTFVRWSNRDTKNFSDKKDPKKTPTDIDYLDVRDPLIVISDCIQVAVNSSKSSHIHQASMTLMGGDINYSTAVAPGDFVLINLVDDDHVLFGNNCTPETAHPDSLYARAKKPHAINHEHDGFKGLFKIQSVRRVLQVNDHGLKTFHYQINAAAFTEFNQVVYFNPYLFTEKELTVASDALNGSAALEYAAVKKVTNNVGNIFTNFIGFLIGYGFPRGIMTQPTTTGVVRNHNKNFLIPSDVGKLMGINTHKTLLAADLFTYYVGIQKYESASDVDDSIGLNPELKNTGHNFYHTGISLSGIALIQAEPWQQVTAWSILNQYSNSLINEMYTSYKLTPDNSVMPVVTFRQKPFTSDLFKKKHPNNINKTTFLELPRWKISPYLITTLSLGRDEAARINFVHIIGKTRYIDQKDAAINQAASKIHQQDNDDIKRNGLKPFITACDFDFPSSESKNMQSPIWNLLVFDWLSNGHLKENGTLVCAGIVEAIAVGDNLQIEDTVFHIESIQHIMQITPDGKKSFTTTIQLSYGVDVGRDGKYNPIYPEMQYPNTQEYRTNEYDHQDQMLPGYSDSQDVGSRKNAEKLKNKPARPFSTSPKRIATTKPKKK